MSETVHYRGIATEIKPTKSQSVEEIAMHICDKEGIKMDDYVVKYHNGSWAWLLADNFYQEYAIVKDKLYKIQKENVDVGEEIIRAKQLEDGSISFELKYYNGGAGFEECLEEAFDKIKDLK